MYLTRSDTFFANTGMLKLVGICLLANVASCNSLRCYVCGGVGDDRNCDDYGSPNQHLFIKDCPPDSQSCSNATDANSVILTRTCELIRANACSVLKDVRYCYCSDSLCNGINNARSSFPSDDEDIEEGSGLEEHRINRLGSVATKPINVSFSNAAYILNPAFTIIVCFGLFI